MKRTENQKPQIDQTDIKILNSLKQDSRVSHRRLAGKLGISGVMASARIKTMEDFGLLKGYTALLDPAKLGYDLTAIIFIQMEGGYIKNLEAELSQMTNVIAVYEITGDFDVVAVVKFKDRETLNLMIKDLLLTRHIKKTMTDVSFNVVREDFRVEI